MSGITSFLKPIFILVFLLLPSLGASQNLVRNASFEDYSNCPKRLGNLKEDVLGWSAPTIGSTDYFNACSNYMGTPKNFNGTQPSDFGKGYAGLYLYAPDDYREYLQTKLAEKLVKGQEYSVSFYVSLAERSDFAIKEFGVLFAKDELDIAIKKELSKGQLYKQKGNSYNYLEIGYTNFYSDTKDWISVSTQFVAKGGEEYLIIGNFKKNARTRKFSTKRNSNQGAYYYVDMVSVKPLSKDKHQVEADGQIESFELDRTHTFENVLFAFDESTLLDVSKKELRKVFDYLQFDSTLQISIDGHTDNIGSKEYNERLSANRCSEVAKYLIQLGLSHNRIIFKGHGGTQPISDNGTESGRRLNRRVEFVISKK